MISIDTSGLFTKFGQSTVLYSFAPLVPVLESASPGQEQTTSALTYIVFMENSTALVTISPSMFIGMLKTISLSTQLVLTDPSLPSSQDLEDVAGSALVYVEDQSQYSDGAPLSEINNSSALHGEESRHQVSLPPQTHEALPQTLATMSFDRISPNLAPIQEDDRMYTPPTCLNTTTSDNQTAGLLSGFPSSLQSSSPIRQELPGSGHGSPGSEPRGGTPSMPMEQVSQDDQSHLEPSGSPDSENQEPHQSDIMVADADDTVTDTIVSGGQVEESLLSSTREEMVQLLDRIPKHMIEAYLEQDGSLGPKNGLPGRDAFADKNRNLPHKCPECDKSFARKCELT